MCQPKDAVADWGEVILKISHLPDNKTAESFTDNFCQGETFEKAEARKFQYRTVPSNADPYHNYSATLLLKWKWQVTPNNNRREVLVLEGLDKALTRTICLWKSQTLRA